MADKNNKLVFAIIKYLKTQLEREDLTEEATEGIEVGIQCLEAAYDFNPMEQSSLDIPCGLQEIFQKYLEEQETSRHSQQEAIDRGKSLAELMKNEGNKNMNDQNFKEAVACYTKAIKLDPSNAVYYCNRAAASNKLGQYGKAIIDCNTALSIDPTYCKAYGRLGLAYTSLNKHQEAVKNYKKAVELEPENESYKTNLKLAEEALASSSAASTSSSISFQNADLQMIFTNPNLLNVASQMLANPSMQTMMNNILSGSIGEGGGGIDVLLQASQQLAQQMESDNPDLVEQLRRHIGSEGDGSSNKREENPDNPPPPQQ